MKPTPVTDFIITDHAAMEFTRRGLSEEMIRQVLADPAQQQDVRRGRIVLQSRVPIGESRKEYLIRVFVDVDRTPAEVVTAYRTSKISKYWREES